MEHIKIKADERVIGKKGVNRRLRTEGLVPAVLYGDKQAPKGLQVNRKEITSQLKKLGTNALIELDLGGSGNPLIVLLKDFQSDVMSRHLTHLDFYRVDMKKKLLVKVPLKFTGKCLGVTKGGLLEQLRREVEVQCLPNKIPDFIEVDISELDLGHSIHVHELKLPEGVEAHGHTEVALITVALPREEKAEEPTATAEAAAAAPADAKAAADAKPAAGGKAAEAKPEAKKDAKK